MARVINPLAPTIPICSQAVWRRQFPYVPKKLRFSPPLLLQSVAQPSCGRLKNRKVQRLSHLLGLYLSIFNNPRCVINYIYSRVCKIKLIYAVKSAENGMFIVQFNEKALTIWRNLAVLSWTRLDKCGMYRLV